MRYSFALPRLLLRLFLLLSFRLLFLLLILLYRLFSLHLTCRRKVELPAHPRVATVDQWCSGPQCGKHATKGNRKRRFAHLNGHDHHERRNIHARWWHAIAERLQSLHFNSQMLWPWRVGGRKAICRRVL